MEKEFKGVSLSQQSLMDNQKFAGESSSSRDDGYRPVESKEIVMVSPPTSSDSVNVGPTTPNPTPTPTPTDLYQTPPEDGVVGSKEKEKEEEVVGSVRVLPPSILGGSAAWGDGKWLQDGRRRAQKQNDNKKEDVTKEDNNKKKLKIPIREVVRAIVKNNGLDKDMSRIEKLSFLDICKLKGINFPVPKKPTSSP